MQPKKTLVLNTLEFPYGQKETFLETEIKFYAKYFDRIFIIPSSKGNGTERTVPDNITVLSDLAERKKSYSPIKTLPFLFSFIRIFIFCQRNSKKPYLKAAKSLLHHFFNDFSTYQTFISLIKKHQLNDAIFYDYWLVNKSLCLIEAKRKGLINKIIARAHRFDLYDDNNSEGLVPFKEYKVAKLDQIYTISMHGYNYLTNEFPQFKHKIANSYLGVPAVSNVAKPQESPTVISCSSIIPFKRVKEIAKAISQVKTSCKWIHFGDGPLMAEVKDECENFPEHIHWELKGFVNNSEVLDYYSKKPPHCFISLSSSEGLPVSMMEVQACGIPIIAPPINGIPEIITSETGILLPKDYTTKNVTEALDTILGQVKTFDQESIRSFFNNHFNSAQNYDSFVKELSAQWD